MIYVANIPKEGIGAFSHKFRLILELIEGGPQWLRFAMRNQADAYVARTEAELLALIQEGLHASSQMVLGHLNLMVAPYKLWSLPEEDLALLGTAKKGDSIKDVLARNKLADFDALQQGIDFLSTHGLKESPPFQVMNLGDRLALIDITQEIQGDENGNNGSSLTTEACQFAARSCQNAREFSDGYRFFMAVQEKYPARTKKTRAKRVQVVWEDYNELCDNLVETITIGKGFDSKDMTMKIKNALAGLRQIGFSNKPAAMNNLFRNTELKCQDIPEAKKIIATYMEATTNLISTGELQSQSISQDGMTQLVMTSALAGVKGQAILDVNRLGVVTLFSATVTKIL